MRDHTMKPDSSLGSQNTISCVILPWRLTQWLQCPKQMGWDRALLNLLFPSPWLVSPWVHKASWRFGSVSDPFCIWYLRDSFAAGGSARALPPSAFGWTLSSYSLFWNSKWVTFPRSHGKRTAGKKAALFTPLTADLLTLSTEIFSELKPCTSTSMLCLLIS